MLILAAVPDIQLLNRRRAAAARFTLARAGSWAEALSTIRTRPVELAVVDPLLSGEPRTREIERLRVLFPSLPLVLYTTLTPRTAGVLLTLGQRGIEHVIIARYDDHPLRLREVLAEEEAHSASRLLLDQLADALAPLPRVGLPSPRQFLAAARVLYAHRLLQDPGFTIEDVAQRLGYAQAKTLQQHARSYLGLTAGEMRLSLSPQEALERLTRRFLKPQHSRQVIAS